MIAEPHLHTWDPPDDETALALGEFLRGQAPDPGAFPREKLGYLRWKLALNEVHGGFATAVRAGERWVGLCTVTPKRLWVAHLGREVRWAEIGDTFTDPAWQRRGFFAALVDATRRRAQAAGFALVYGLPNEQSRPGYVGKLGFAVKTDLPLWRAYVPLTPRAVAALPALVRRVRLRAGLGHPLLAAACAGVLGQALRLVDAAPLDSEGGITVEFDDLWQEVRGALPYAQARDARYLSWRYGRCPFAFRVLGLRRGGALRGYAVLHHGHSARTPGLRHTLLCDWLYAPGDGAAARALLRGAVLEALGAGADLLSALYTPRTPLPLPFPAPALLQRPAAAPVIFHQNAEAAALIEDPAPFHFTLSDTDTI